VPAALILFTKVPEPGSVKTRLTGEGRVLSIEDASRLYSDVLLDVFDIMTDIANRQDARLYVSFTPSNAFAKLRNLLGDGDRVNFIPQEGTAIAERIANAAGRAIEDGNDAAIIVFGDQPGLDSAVVIEALRVLDDARQGNERCIVLGPTCDGGTYLIGVTGDLRDWLRHNIDCTDSSKAVGKLLVQARREGIESVLLDERLDLDDPLDLWLLKREPLPQALRTAQALKRINLASLPQAPFDLSIIIPTLEEEENLEKTIQSLRAQRSPRTEIIVVDGGSVDRTLEIANQYADRVVCVRNPGRQRQENVGSQGAKGTVLLFLHADTKPSPNLLSGIQEAMLDPIVLGGGAHLAYFPERLRYRVLCALREAVSRLLSIQGMGSSFFVRRDIFDRIGGFDERMNEEGVDMSKKLRQFGKVIILNEYIRTSARRFETLGFMRTVFLWALTVALSYLGVRAVSIEKYVWRVVR
jgi:glycosyltransferase A (GT-A) superfamily protein (DUF2064 family)